MDTAQKREAWNKGKMIGQKPPLKPKNIWAIRIHLQNKHAVRDLAMFNLAIDSKLRGCDLVNLRVRDVTHGNQILPRAIVIQRRACPTFCVNRPLVAAVLTGGYGRIVLKNSLSRRMAPQVM